MSFFTKANDNNNLKFDDTGFLHFATAMSLAMMLALIGVIFADIKKWRAANNFTHLNQQQKKQFKIQIKLTQQTKMSKLMTSGFVSKIVVLIVLIVAAAYCGSLASEQAELVGFDPYSILNIEMGASQSQIKKAYRKLALEHHPDRNKNNPKSALQFILISKAYKCFTNDEARQKCEMYGNPDGEQTSKLGIGLPSLMLQPQNKYLILVTLLAVLLVLAPMWLLKWGNGASARNEVRTIFKNKQIISNLMNPALSDLGCCLLLASLQSHDELCQSFQPLNPHLQTQFKNQAIKCNPAVQEALNSMTSSQILRAYNFYKYIRGESNNLIIALAFPKLCQQLIQLASLFAKKSLSGKKLTKQSKIIINWYGLIPLKKAIQFSRNMFNKAYNFNSDLENIIISQSAPQLKLQAKITIDQIQVHEMTSSDIAYIHIFLNPSEVNNSTTQYCYCPNYPLMAESHYILLISYNSNLLAHLIIKLSPQFHHKIKLPVLPRKKITLNVKVMSLSYNLNLQQNLSIQIFSKIQDRKIQFHPEDQIVQTKNLNFFERLIKFSKQDDSDLQLSDSQNQEQNIEKNNKIQNSNNNIILKNTKNMKRIKNSLKLINKKRKAKA